jgi:lipopolysaccharide biosynthesis glycosyltransferase
MIIATATDRAYVELAGVSLRSIHARGDVPEARIVVFVRGVSAPDCERLRACMPPHRVEIVPVPPWVDDKLAGLSEKAYFTRTAYVRLLIGELLPEARERLLYLDSDVMVNGSLRPLLTFDMAGHPLAAVQDPAHPDVLRAMNVRIGRPAEAPYVNSGVLLVDMARWRELDLGRRCLERALASPGYHLPDQDALNFVLDGDVALMDRKWNLFTEHAHWIPVERYALAPIIHFSGYRKPNFLECDHPLRGEFLRHRQDTPWRDAPLLTRRPRRGPLGLLDRARMRWLKRGPRPVSAVEYRHALRLAAEAQMRPGANGNPAISG